MNAVKSYYVVISNQNTPGTLLFRNQQMTVMTGDGIKYTTINTLGLSQNTFQLEGFNLPTEKVIIKSYNKNNELQTDFTVYRNVYAEEICFGFDRGFLKSGNISFTGD